MSIEHRKKANKGRNGRTKYQKGHRHYSQHSWLKFKGKKGSATHNPEVPKSTLADVWPSD